VIELRCVAESFAFHVVVADLNHAFCCKRFRRTAYFPKPTSPQEESAHSDPVTSRLLKRGWQASGTKAFTTFDTACGAT
jgi:hypothetical protein